MSQVTFVAYIKPQPQGSLKPVPVGRGRVVLISDNEMLKPFRHELCRIARYCLSAYKIEEPMAKEHDPVELHLEYTFLKPKGAPKRRKLPSVKPDLDKLVRATLDALTGVIYQDDGQVVNIIASKIYGPIEQVHVSARIVSTTEG